MRFAPTEISVRFYELDPYNHVNHAVYLSYFETARINALESVDMGLELLAERGYMIVVREIQAQFHAPAVAGDSVRIATEMVETRRASHHWVQEMTRDADPIASLRLRAAMVDLDGRPVRIPDFFKKAIGHD